MGKIVALTQQTCLWMHIFKCPSPHHNTCHLKPGSINYHHGNRSLTTTRPQALAFHSFPFRFPSRRKNFSHCLQEHRICHHRSSWINSAQILMVVSRSSFILDRDEISGLGGGGSFMIEFSQWKRKEHRFDRLPRTVISSSGDFCLSIVSSRGVKVMGRFWWLFFAETSPPVITWDS